MRLMIDDRFDKGSIFEVFPLLLDFRLLDGFVVQLTEANVCFCRVFHFGRFDRSTILYSASLSLSGRLLIAPNSVFEIGSKLLSRSFFKIGEVCSS